MGEIKESDSKFPKPSQEKSLKTEVKISRQIRITSPLPPPEALKKVCGNRHFLSRKIG